MTKTKATMNVLQLIKRQEQKAERQKQASLYNVRIAKHI